VPPFSIFNPVLSLGFMRGYPITKCFVRVGYGKGLATFLTKMQASFKDTSNTYWGVTTVQA
jgi:hypothetical protein